MKQILFLVSLYALVALSCNKDDVNYDEIDHDLILNYLAENNLTAEEHSTGFFYIIDAPGGSQSPANNSNVKVRYKGYLLNGDVFDQFLEAEGTVFTLNRLIAGWQIGIPLIGRNGTITLFLPSRFGYGSSPPSGIPSNAVLIFEIDLIDFSG